jgi:hypothetical protein
MSDGSLPSVVGAVGSGFDRAAYQREYMRAWRARKKDSKS